MFHLKLPLKIHIVVLTNVAASGILHYSKAKTTVTLCHRGWSGRLSGSAESKLDVLL